MSKLNLDEFQRNRPTLLRIKVRIPQEYQEEPIITNLAAKYDLKVNIVAAMLGLNGAGDGWFDLLLSGGSENIDNGLIYLSEMNIDIWHKSQAVQDGW